MPSNLLTESLRSIITLLLSEAMKTAFGFMHNSFFFLITSKRQVWHPCFDNEKGGKVEDPFLHAREGPDWDQYCLCMHLHWYGSLGSLPLPQCLFAWFGLWDEFISHYPVHTSACSYSVEFSRSYRAEVSQLPQHRATMIHMQYREVTLAMVSLLPPPNLLIAGTTSAIIWREPWLAQTSSVSASKFQS